MVIQWCKGGQMYPMFTRSERIADGAVHIAGVGFALFGAIALFIYAIGALNGGQIAALSIYGVALIGTFSASAIYHFPPVKHWQPTLRRIDHAAIFIKIAGTYTPLVVLIGTTFAWMVLGLVWTLALIGAGLKLFLWREPGRMELMLYLALGWISLMLAWPLISTAPALTSGLVALGGLLYTAGVFFFNAQRVRFSNAIWHIFVLIASICFFSAITVGMIPPR